MTDTSAANTQIELNPVFKENIITTCFACDNKFTPYLGVALQSLVDTSTSQYNYDVVILTEFISEENQRLLLSITKNHDNISLRFYNVQSIHQQYGGEFYIQDGFHVDIPTYYRFYIPIIFKEYEKVVYLDSDIIIQQDIAELYNTNLDGAVFGVNYDIPSIYFYNKIFSRKAEFEKALGNNSIEEYFNAGVMIFNISECKSQNIFEQIKISVEKVPNPTLADQDILNYLVLHNNISIKRIDFRWNTEMDCLYIGLNDLSQYLSPKWESIYRDSIKNPYIIHYCGPLKPWKDINIQYASEFWSVARNTPFYEKLLFANIIENIYTNFKAKLKQIIGSEFLWKLGRFVLNFLKKVCRMFSKNK